VFTTGLLAISVTAEVFGAEALLTLAVPPLSNFCCFILAI